MKLARISDDQYDAYVCRVGAVVLYAYHKGGIASGIAALDKMWPAPRDDERTALLAGRYVNGVMDDLKQIKTHAAGLRDAINKASAATIQFAKNEDDEDLLSDHKEQIVELLRWVEHLLAEAHHNRRRRGRQSRSVRGENATEYERFVDHLLRAIFDVGGELTVDKNGYFEGDLPKFLRGLEPILPPALVKALSDNTLYRIRDEARGKRRKRTANNRTGKRRKRTANNRA
jgi:hypothetical protein